MRFKVTMKSPDAVSEAVNDAVRDSITEAEHALEPEDLRDLKNERREELHAACAPWFEYGEYLTVEIDTEAGTATVCRP